MHGCAVFTRVIAQFAAVFLTKYDRFFGFFINGLPIIRSLILITSHASPLALNE